MIESIAIIIISFLIGSLPTAYLMLKYFHGKDIRIEGTGNVGALNAFEVSKSKSSGIIVLVVDALKGMFAIALIQIFFRNNIWYETFASIAVVAGHNFSPWVGFKGGRGLATAAGVSIIFYLWFLLFWVVGWLITFLMTKNIHWGNIAATIFLPVIFFIIILIYPDFVSSQSNTLPLVVTVWGMSTLIMIKHIKPFQDLLK